MGWNETPGGNKEKDKDKDPWGKRGDKEGPPDLDELLRKMQDGFGGLFGRRSGAPGANSSPSYSIVIVFLFLLAWLSYDITYTIDQQERGIVLRFGAYVTLLQPGLNFRLPYPIEEVIIINTGQVRDFTHKSVMLTQDENIVDVEVAVQWRINDSVAYQFNVVSPDQTLQQATESAVREVIGKSNLDFVLTEGRGQISDSQQKLIQQIMDDYRTGIEIVSVRMQPAKPPEEVKSAFDDAIKSREDQQRLVNEAQAYQNDLLPRARGNAARLLEEANGYKARIVSRAEGDASRFEQLLTEYAKAPEVTRQRLYLESMEKVLSNTSKILLDTQDTNNLIYVPIDKIMERRTDMLIPDTQSGTSRTQMEAPPSTAVESNERTTQRSRGSR